MRLSELHLDRYGPFTDRRLAFETGRDLVIVHGRNEAGKSSALAALADAFFGIEPRSRYDFVHDYGAMRVGATVEAADGRRLVFRRRKGNKATLLDAEDRPIAEDALAAFLGRVDRALFAGAFGLGQAELRKGGESLAAGGGSLGEALLAASPGLGRLVELRRDLAASADQMFTERRSAGKPFYVALDAWTDARRRLGETSLSADALRRTAAALAEAEAATAALETERRDLRIRLGRLQRLARALPLVASVDRLSAELAGRADRPAIDDGFTAEARTVTAVSLRAATERDLIERDRAAAQDALAAVHVDDALLDAGDAIGSLAGGRSERIAWARDLAEAEAAALAAGPALDAAARRLGLGSAADLAARPATTSIARVRALAGDRAALDARLAAARDQRRTAESRRSGLVAERGAAPALADPRFARAALAELGALPAAQRAADERRADAETALRRAEAARARLVAAGIADPAAVHRPDRDRTANLAEALAAAERDLVDAERRAADLRGRAAEAASRAADLAAAGDLPSDAAVAAARVAREEAWSEVRALLFADAPAPAAARHVAARGLERETEAADRLADRRSVEAGRLAAHAAAVATANRAAAEAEAAERALEAAGRRAETARAEWDRHLVEAGLPVRDPRSAADLVDSHAAWEAQRDAAEAAETAARLAARELGRLDEAATAAAAAAGTVRGAGEPWLPLVARIRASVDEAEAAWTAARDRERDIADLVRREGELAAMVAAVEAETETWGAAWAGAVAALGLPADARLEEAEAAIAVWTEIAGLDATLREAGERSRRLAAACAAYDSEAARLAATFGLEPGLPAVDAAARLAALLEEAKLAAERRRQLAGRAAALDDRLAALDAEAEAAAAAEARLRAAAGLSANEDLQAAAAEAREARALRARLDEARAALAELASGTDAAALRAEAAATDPDRLAAEIAAAEEDLTRLDDRHAAAVAERTRAAADHAALAARDGAESAGQDAENAVALLAERADEWRVLQAAARLAGAVVEEYRRRHQNPVLGEAARLFAKITGGRYPALSPDFDDAGEARLVAVRDDGRRLSADALSEGTADQLFLALRLATLVDHARRAEPLPFLGDDLFVTFDEARTAAGLEVLADVGRTMQTILFTHHAHVVDLARDRLGDRIQVIDL